jgi:hypothetical protein
MLMKKGLFEEALRSLLKSFEIAKEDKSDSTDAARFKIQELHMLNSLLRSGFSLVEYKAKAKFALPRSLKNQNLIEANMNALSQTYDLDEDLFKELIGHLNWRKFSDRVQE